MNSIDTLDAMFAHPILIERLDLDVDKIYKFCYDSINSGKIKSAKKSGSNHGGWQSDHIDFDSIDDSEFNLLVHKIRQIANEKVSSKMGIIPSLNINSMWINITRNGNYNSPHHHVGSILSGTFYVKTPKNCGSIEFENPISGLIDSYLTHWHLSDGHGLKSSSWLSKKINIVCEENTLILFPSWIKHSVEQNLNKDEDRISIAFNLTPER
jgi:uncharacterized protein (TIGR02466 family)